MLQPVIPAIKSSADLHAAAALGCGLVVVVRGDIFEVTEMAETSRANRIQMFLHVDLTEGIGKDKAGLRFLHEQTGIAGIVSTRTHLIREAQTLGMRAILRFFVLDSMAYETGVNMVRTAHPDAIELLPGIALPRVAEEVRRDIEQPVIAAGLIRTDQDVRDALANGALAVSTTQQELWRLRP